MASAPNGQTLPQPDTVQEPSMEDILASIRRIIASDQQVGHGRTFGRPAKNADKGLDFADNPGAGAASPPDDGEDSNTASMSPEPFAAPVEFPELHDLDALVLPPAPIERRTTSEMDRSHGSRHELTSTFDDELLAPAEPPASARPVFDLQMSDRVSPVSEPETLISSFAGASVSSSFQALADTVLMRDPEMIERLTREAFGQC